MLWTDPEMTDVLWEDDGEDKDDSDWTMTASLMNNKL
jgi:hypothetical protein